MGFFSHTNNKLNKANDCPTLTIKLVHAFDLRRYLDLYESESERWHVAV